MAAEITPIYRRVRATVWLPLGFMYASYYMCRYNLSFGASKITKLYGWSNEQWGWIVAAGFWLYALGQFVNGQITDRLGGRKAIMIGAIGTIAMNCMMALGTNFGVLGYFIVMWGANGYFQAFGAPSIVSVNGNWFGLKERGTFTGIFGMMIQLGRFGITLLGGFLIANYDWTAIFLVPAAITAFFAVIGWFSIRDHPEDLGFEAPDHGEHDRNADTKPAGIAYTMKKVLTSPVLWVISGAYFCTGVVRHGLEQWFPKYLQEVQQLAPDSMAFQLRALAMPVSAVLGAFAAGVASDKLFGSRRGPPAAIMYFIQFVLLIMFYYWSGPVAAAVLLILLSFFVNGPHSLLGGAAAMDFGGRKAAGSAAGMIDAFQYVGAGLAQPAVGWVIDTYGWSGWMISLSAFALLGGILMSTLWNARPKGDGGTSRNHSGGGTGPNKPGAVQSAVILFYISLGIGVIRSVLEASTLAEMAPPWFLMLISYLVLGVMWLLVFMIGRGRSWARTTFLVLFVVGIPFSIQPLLLSLAVFPISGFAFVGQTLLQIVVLVLLYQKKSSEWFRRTATSNERPL